MLPPEGSIKVSAPRRVAKREIAEFVLSRYQWILQAQAEIRSRPKPEKQLYLPGDRINFCGTELSLELISARRYKNAIIDENTLKLYLPENLMEGIEDELIAQRSKYLDKFYRAYLSEKIQCRIPRELFQISNAW